MSEDKTDFFKCPAYKLMISDIRHAIQKVSASSDDTSDSAETEWHLTISNLATKSGQLQLETVRSEKSPFELQLKLIWIQGTVLRIEKSDDDNHSLVITDEEDETTEAIVYEYNSVPGGDHPGIQIGSYVGALGQIWSNNPVIIVKATKIMNLSDSPIHKNIWKDEVTLSKAYLAGLILPSSTVT